MGLVGDLAWRGGKDLETLPQLAQSIARGTLCPSGVGGSKPASIHIRDCLQCHRSPLVVCSCTMFANMVVQKGPKKQAMKGGLGAQEGRREPGSSWGLVLAPGLLRMGRR